MQNRYSIHSKIQLWNFWGTFPSDRKHLLYLSPFTSTPSAISYFTLYLNVFILILKGGNSPIMEIKHCKSTRYEIRSKLFSDPKYFRCHTFLFQIHMASRVWGGGGHQTHTDFRLRLEGKCICGNSNVKELFFHG